MSFAVSPSSAPSSTADWIETFARFGFAAKGAVYSVLGVLAVQTAWYGAQNKLNARGAVAAIAQQPFGQVLLWLTTVGLFGYATWRFMQAALDPENEGTDWKALGKRIGWASSAFAHTLLAATAANSALQSSAQSGGQSQAQEMTAQLMAQPWGAWMVGIIGLGIGIAAFVQAYRAWSASFMKRLDNSASASTRKWIERAGRAGHAARAVVFGIIGFFLVQAAMSANAGRAVGLDGSLKTLAGESYGQFFLMITAVGLFLYGAYMVVKAKYRSFETSES